MNQLARLRNEALMTLEEIGEYTGTSKQSVHAWVNGVNTPTGKRAMMLEKLYKVKFPEAHLKHEYIPNYGKIQPNPEFENLPFISVPARASFVEMSSQEKDYGISERMFVLKDRTNEDLRNCICIEVGGDSMDPQLRSGDVVLGRLVDRSNWEYMASGVYAINYANFFVIKRLKNNELAEKGCLRLHSDNPQGGELVVPVTQLHYIWKIDRGVKTKIQ